MLKKVFIIITITYTGCNAMESPHEILPYSPILEQALEIALQWHDGTYRKGGGFGQPLFTFPNGQKPQVPVGIHVMAVGLTLLKNKWDENTVAAGFLHDVLEDPNKASQRLPEESLRKAMGDTITNLVLEVSEKKEDETGRALTWQERKEKYLQHLQVGTNAAMAISLADKINNLTTINKMLTSGQNILDSFNGQPKNLLWFYDSVLQVSENHKDVRLNLLRETYRVEVEKFKQFIKK